MCVCMFVCVCVCERERERERENENSRHRHKVVAVHNNYLVGHENKKRRFIAHGLWALPHQHYTSTAPCSTDARAHNANTDGSTREHKDHCNNNQSAAELEAARSGGGGGGGWEGRHRRGMEEQTIGGSET
jgi:hypothetical protein